MSPGSSTRWRVLTISVRTQNPRVPKGPSLLARATLYPPGSWRPPLGLGGSPRAASPGPAPLHSGATVGAIRLAREVGKRTIAITSIPASPLATEADEIQVVPTLTIAEVVPCA